LAKRKEKENREKKKNNSWKKEVTLAQEKALSREKLYIGKRESIKEGKVVRRQKRKII
jgi:hypothetical protein